MSIEKLNSEIELLKLVTNKIKKAPNRERTPEKAKEELEQINTYYRNIHKYYEIIKAEDTNIAQGFEKLLLKAREDKNRAIEIIRATTKEEEIVPSGSQLKQSHSTEENQAKMDTFDYGRAQKLPILSIKSSDNRSEAIRDFINNIDFYHDNLDNASREKLVKFIIMCKIQGKTLSELGKVTVTTWNELKMQLWNKCGPRDTLESIQTKLNNARQGQRPMRTFVNDIEQLINDMTNLEVKSQDEEARPALQAANERRGLAFLKKGVNEKYKIILECARHTNFHEAVQHLLEMEPETNQNSEHIRYHDTPRADHQHNNVNRGRPFSTRQNYHQNRQQFQQNRQNNPSFQRQNPFRNNNNRGYNRGQSNYRNNSLYNNNGSTQNYRSTQNNRPTQHNNRVMTMEVTGNEEPIDRSISNQSMEEEQY